MNKIILSCLLAFVCGVTFSATPYDVENYVQQARKLYSTTAWRDYTNSLVPNVKVKAQDFADRPYVEIENGVVKKQGLILWKNVDGVRNVRDIGGWNGILTGRVFRGSEADCWPREKVGEKHFHNLNITDSGLKVIRDDLKIKTDLDLRGVGECVHPNVSAFGDDVKLIRVPLGAYMGAFSQTNQYQAAMRVFANADNYPIYFHCWGGADRTGTIAYLLEGLCGVNEVDLAIDYELTSFCALFGWRLRSEDKSYKFVSFVQRLKSYSGETLSAKIENYCLNTLGLTAEEIKAIRINLKGMNK